MLNMAMQTTMNNPTRNVYSVFTLFYWFHMSCSSHNYTMAICLVYLVLRHYVTVTVIILGKRKVKGHKEWSLIRHKMLQVTWSMDITDNSIHPGMYIHTTVVRLNRIETKQNHLKKGTGIL